MKPEGKVTCPFCGAEIGPDALACSSCGNSWNDVGEREFIRNIMKIPGMGEKRTKKLMEEGIERVKEADGDDLMAMMKKAGIPVKLADDVRDRLQSHTSLHMCPECGAFVPGDAATCPLCGADLSAGEEELQFQQSEVNDVRDLQDDLFLEGDTNVYLCRVCGAFITDAHEKCPVCGAPMPENRADMPLHVEDRLQDDERNIRAIQGFFGVQDINRLEKLDVDILSSVTELDICSSCGAFVRPEASKCPVCGAELVPEIDEEENREATDMALMELEALKSELIGADIEEPEPEVSEYYCPECGSPVPAEASACPECGAIFEEEGVEPEQESHEELVLSLEDVLTEDEVPAETHAEEGEVAVAEAEPEPVMATEEAESPEEDIFDEDEERIKEEMKEEMDFIFAPLPVAHREEAAPAPTIESPEEKEELAKVLEGGLDEIAAPEDARVSAQVEEISVSTAEDSTQYSPKWSGSRDLVMAASAIGAALMASEYLLTNGVVPNPMLAYGIASLSIFIPILIAGMVLLILDRKYLFRERWSAAASALPLMFPMLIMALWFSPVEMQEPVLSDTLYIILYLLALLSLWILIKERLEPFWIWFLGIVQISVHSLIFVNGSYPWLPADPIPSYMLAFTGGIMLSMGVYLRIDAAVRSLLATRDVVMGHRHYMSGDYEEAMKYYSRALGRKRPYESGYDLAYYSKGTALLSSGNALEALKYLNRAVKANPNNEMAWNNRGIALAKLGLDEGALKSYERALMINPNYDVAWNNKGNVLARMGRYKEALECYDRALSMNPQYRDAWMNKGYVLIKLDRYREAKECADHVLRPQRRKKLPMGISPDIE